MMTTGYENIELRNGEPYVAGTQMKVRMLVRHHLGYGWDGEELHRNFSHLTLSQIYSALAYYYEHKEEIDRDIEERARSVDDMLSQFPEPAEVGRLRSARGDA